MRIITNAHFAVLQMFAARALAIGLIGLSMRHEVHAQLTHLYDLNGSYADAFGGPSLVPNSGTLNSTNYTFGMNQGLSLSNALSNNATYSILLDFSFTDLNGYKKIVDFQNRATDTGLYNLNTTLNFYNVTSGPPAAFVPNLVERLVITRDASNQFTGYINGVQQLTFADSTSLGVFSTPTTNIINFFIDDAVTNGEASAGLVDRIALYGSALTAAQVRELGVPSEISGPTPPNTVPDAGSTLMMLGGAFGTLVNLKRKFFC
jgi:hypothetical protein